MIKKIIILSGIGFLIFPYLVLAQDANSSQPKLSDVKNILARCPIVESKIQVKVTNFDNIKIKHLRIYDKVKEKLVVLTDKLEAQGIVVANLRSYLVVFDQKVKTFSDDYSSYIYKLKESQVFVCGRSEGEFRGKLKESKTALAQVHKDAVDIRNYYAKTIKPEINRIRIMIKNQNNASTSVEIIEPEDDIETEIKTIND